MSYYKARVNSQQKKIAKDIYITDALKVITSNIAGAFGGQIITMRFCDIFSEKKQETAEEIIDRIKGKLNGCI